MDRMRTLSVALLILSALFWLVESLFTANPQQSRPSRRRGFTTDLVYWFGTPLLTKSISQIGLAVILVLILRENIRQIPALLAHRDTWLGRQPLALQVVEMLIVGDYIGYWLHRWFHGRRMWKFHAVHHSSTSLDWLSSVRVHPVNDWVSRWIQASALVVLGFSPLAIAAYIPFLTFYAIFIHANVSWGLGRVGRFIASPKFHRWHHTSEDEGLDKNFAGLFPWIDRVHGTYYMPEDRLPVTFGLKNQSVPDGFIGQLLYPFR
jgi:sterol desaturase/sphingolipid hydroxylase (fatty acid hydroxylase superfamily)